MCARAEACSGGDRRKAAREKRLAEARERREAIARQPEQRGEFGVANVTSDTQNKKMLHGYIVDPESGKNVAVIRHGEVFRDDKEGARIAIVINANLYDLNGNWLGRLDGQHVIDVGTWVMPIAFRNPLEGKS